MCDRSKEVSGPPTDYKLDLTSSDFYSVVTRIFGRWRNSQRLALNSRRSPPGEAICWRNSDVRRGERSGRQIPPKLLVLFCG